MLAENRNGLIVEAELTQASGTAEREAGLRLLARRRKIVEEGFGWMKDVGGLRKLRHRGKAKASAMFTFACAAYNLVRLRTLLAELALT